MDVEVNDSITGDVRLKSKGWNALVHIRRKWKIVLIVWCAESDNEGNKMEVDYVKSFHLPFRF